LYEVIQAANIKTLTEFELFHGLFLWLNICLLDLFDRVNCFHFDLLKFSNIYPVGTGKKIRQFSAMRIFYVVLRMAGKFYMLSIAVQAQTLHLEKG
jgi:hypothetical protein